MGRASASPKRQNGEIVIRYRLFSRNQLQNVVNGNSKARRDRLAGVNQNNQVESGLIGMREATEIAYDPFAVDHRKVRFRQIFQRMIVFVGSEEGHTNFGDGAAIGGQAGVIVVFVLIFAFCSCNRSQDPSYSRQNQEGQRNVRRFWHRISFIGERWNAPQLPWLPLEVTPDRKVVKPLWKSFALAKDAEEPPKKWQL